MGLFDYFAEIIALFKSVSMIIIVLAFLSALRISAALANQAAFLVNQAVGVAALGTGSGNGVSAVGDEFFKGSFDPVLPGVD